MLFQLGQKVWCVYVEREGKQGTCSFKGLLCNSGFSGGGRWDGLGWRQDDWHMLRRGSMRRRLGKLSEQCWLVSACRGPPTWGQGGGCRQPGWSEWAPRHGAHKKGRVGEQKEMPRTSELQVIWLGPKTENFFPYDERVCLVLSEQRAH